jgi:hypothetical protein
MLPLFIACTQPEGFGGNSHIKGVIIERFYNNDMSVLQREEPAMDENVYINFGADETVGENTSTSYSGNFEFEYLWPGNYKLYYYTDDTATQGKKAIVKEITLEKNSTQTLDTLYINTLLNWDEGYATVTGKIRMVNYTNSSKWPNLEIKDIAPAQDMDVYLVYNNQPNYTERIRTVGDGSYTFSNLLKGHYKIFFYSEDKKGGTELIVKSFEFEITETNQVMELEATTIDKL